MSTNITDEERIRMELIVRITCSADTIHHLIRLPSMEDLTIEELLSISDRLWEVYNDLLAMLNLHDD